MSDIRDLKKRNLFNYAPECILVIFETTKTNWQAAWRLDHLALSPKKYLRRSSVTQRPEDFNAPDREAMLSPPFLNRDRGRWGEFPEPQPAKSVV
jgi:hypothetical protein